jgi:hypothetical protein
MESRATFGPAAEPARDPRISGRIVAELRAQMLDLGVWERVRAKMEMRDPLGLRWLDDAVSQPWVDLDTYVSVIECVGEALGAEELRELGRGRVARSTRVGLLAPYVPSDEPMIEPDADSPVIAGASAPSKPPMPAAEQRKGAATAKSAGAAKPASTSRADSKTPKNDDKKKRKKE